MSIVRAVANKLAEWAFTESNSSGTTAKKEDWLFHYNRLLETIKLSFYSVYVYVTLSLYKTMSNYVALAICHTM